MQPQQRRRVRVTASTSDPFDGIVRLVLDAARFGFDLDQVSMAAACPDAGRRDAGWMIRMTLEVQPSVDCAVITDRLSRHPTITNLRVAELSGDDGESPEAAHSSMLANA